MLHTQIFELKSKFHIKLEIFNNIFLIILLNIMPSALSTKTQTLNIHQNESNCADCSQKSKKQQKYAIKQEPTVYEMVHYQADSLLQQVVYMLIRPPRFLYNKFLINPSKKTERFYLQTHNLPDFQLSVYLPVNQIINYIILYLHGNSSSRLQGFLYLNQLPQNVGLACFDFNGCGNRKNKKQIDFLTLGKQQSKQVDIAAKYLKGKGFKVVGWGRSMGAVSLLLSHQVQILIVDSPYQSLLKLCKQSEEKIVPCYLKCFAFCFFQCIFQKIKERVLQLSGMKIQQMEISEKINRNSQRRQICFIHAQNDELISHQHSQKLYEVFQGRKQYILFEGSHNSNRSRQVIEACIQFIDESFQIIELEEMEQKSKITFAKQSKSKKLNEMRLQAFNSLKKNKNKIYLPKLQQRYQLKRQQRKRAKAESIEEAQKQKKIQHQFKQMDSLRFNNLSKADIDKIIVPNSQTPMIHVSVQESEAQSQINDENFKQKNFIQNSQIIRKKYENFQGNREQIGQDKDQDQDFTQIKSGKKFFPPLQKEEQKIQIICKSLAQKFNNENLS